MGGFFSSFFAPATTDTKVLMLGMDGAGKTSILYRLKLPKEDNVHTIPTLGFNTETVELENVRMEIWDICGNDGTRRWWNHYFTDEIDGIIWVVDSAEGGSRDGFLRDEFDKTMAHDGFREDIPVLIFANKQDLPDARSAMQVCDGLRTCGKYKKNWYIQACSITKGDTGLYEGMRWLTQQLKETHPNEKKKMAKKNTTDII